MSLVLVWLAVVPAVAPASAATCVLDDGSVVMAAPLEMGGNHLLGVGHVQAESVEAVVGEYEGVQSHTVFATRVRPHDGEAFVRVDGYASLFALTSGSYELGTGGNVLVGELELGATAVGELARITAAVAVDNSSGGAARYVLSARRDPGDVLVAEWDQDAIRVANGSTYTFVVSGLDSPGLSSSTRYRLFVRSSRSQTGQSAELDATVDLRR